MRGFAQIRKEAPRGPIEKRDWKVCSGEKNSAGLPIWKCKISRKMEEKNEKLYLRPNAK
jgi:hypothetical protein